MFKTFTKLAKFTVPKPISIVSKPFFAFAAPVHKLNIQANETPATIVRKPDSILVHQWWSQTPFDENKPLFVPVFGFQNGEFSGENVELTQEVFNLPLRRDILYRAYHWRSRAGKFTTHITRTKATTSGSGKKPMKQKGNGKARWGNLRAPGRKKGGKAHGAKPTILAYPLNRKIRLLAYKTFFSAKLAEGKLRIVDSEELEEPKTRLVAEAFKNKDKRISYLIITAMKPDANFLAAVKNIPNVSTCTPMNMNICDMLETDKIVLTKQGLEDLVQVLLDRTHLQNRTYREYDRELNPSEERYLEAIGKERFTRKLEMPTYDPSKPLNLKFKILREYLEDYEKYKLGDWELKPNNAEQKDQEQSSKNQ